MDPSGYDKDGAIINGGIPGVVDPEEMVANGLDNLRSEYIVLYDPAYEEEIESRLREEYLESSLLGKGGVIIKVLGHAAAKRYRYAKAKYQVGMYEAVGINHKESEKALTIPMFSVATKVVLGYLAKGYKWTKSLKARSKKISTFAKGTGKAVKYTPVNKEPLPDSVAKTFRSFTYTKIITEQEIPLYRAYGGKAGKLGGYWTKTKPQGPLQTVIDSALDQNWGNTTTEISTIKVPKGTTIFEGFAAEQRGLVGGGNQIFIERVDLSWLVK